MNDLKFYRQLATLLEQNQIKLNISGLFKASDFGCSANLKYECRSIHYGHEQLQIVPLDGNTAPKESYAAEYLGIV